MQLPCFSNSVNVSKLDFGRSSITSEPGAGIILFLDKTSLIASADWQYQIGSTNGLVGFFLDVVKFSDHGSLSASAEGVQLRVGISVSADEQGHPRISTTSCCFEVDDLNVTVTGKAR